VPQRFHGHMVRTAGDALLMRFETATDAVLAAFALHHALAPFNLDQPEDSALQLRIGLHQADVVVASDELYGAGVNLAARLASLAQPQQTVVSTEVRDALADGWHVQLQDLGPRYLKHLQEPVRAFVAHSPGSQAKRSFSSQADLRPTVAVVPFVALPANPEYDALGHAIADDVIASLARHPALRVLSRITTAALRNGVRELHSSTLDHAQLRNQLGATYLLTGRLFVSNGRTRLTAELCELESGQVLWTDSAQAEIQSLFMGEDELVPQLVSRVCQQVGAYELARVRSLPMDSLPSYSLFLGAEGLMSSLARQQFEMAQQAFTHLSERHPRQASPHAALARWAVFHMVQGWATDRADATQRALEHCSRALDLDPQHAQAHTAKGILGFMATGDAQTALASYGQALASDPQSAEAWACQSGVYSFLDQPALAQAAAARSLQLSHLDPNRFLYESYAAMADVCAGQYDSAVQHASASLRRHLLHAPSHLLHVGALWLAGRTAHARQAAAAAKQVCPSLVIGSRGHNASLDPQHWRLRLGQAARAAGLP
jgi:adenylate cyclase